jgi:hypothetical protein
MANQPQPFKHHHIVKAFRAAEAAGVRNPMVSIRLPGGATIAIGSKPDEAVIPKSGKTQPASSRKPPAR